MAAHIQIVEDDASIAEVLRFNLEKDGYQVSWSQNGDDALDELFSRTPDLVLLDWMLPDMSGIDIARQLRHNNDTKSVPIIMLTARSQEDDRVRGLDVGADDYVTKPFSVRELQSRIKAHLRRTGVQLQEVQEFGPISIDLEKMRVRRGKRDIHLSPKEFEVLKMLVARPGRAYSRDAILDRVWGIDGDIEIRTVDVVMGRLRRALKRGDERDPIRTIRGMGYAWDENFS